MGNGKEVGKGMQVNDNDIHSLFCLSSMDSQWRSFRARIFNFGQSSQLNQPQQVKEEAAVREGEIEAAKAKEDSIKENPITG